jgi:hypothetical protein
MGSVKRAVKKIARPKVLLPLAVIGTGGAALGAFGPAAKAAMVGAPGAASIGSALHGTASMAPTAGLIGTGGAFAPLSGSLAKGIAFGLKNPFTAKGLATYGGAGLGLASLARMGKPKTEEQKTLGVDPQAQYNLMRLMNEKMGGAYTDEELNILAAPQLSMYGGEYQTITGPERKRRPMFPGLNYSGLTRFAKDGGSIKPKKRPKGIAEMLAAQEEIKQQMEQAAEDRKQKIEQMKEDRDNLISEGRQNIYDSYVDRYEMIQENPLYGPALPPMMTFEEFFTSPGANEEAMADQMFDMRRRERLNPMGRKDGGLMQIASAPDPMAERMDMMENLALDKFGKPLDRLSNDEVIQIEEMIDDMMPMAKGGSVPQTESIPNGMQIDGRGGGFIPMGARERKDDVPAMLAKNEFVMTADAVRAAGGGDVNKGAQRMYDLMNSLESKV